MGLVDNEDLVAELHRTIANRLAHFLDIRNPTVARGIHLDHIDTASLHDRATGITVITRLRYRPLTRQAVEGLCHEARNGRLCCPSGPCEEIAVGNPSCGNRVLERAHHMLLPDHIGEGLWAVLSVEGLIGHGFRRVFRACVL